jgi:hypothetical protein
MNMNKPLNFNDLTRFANQSDILILLKKIASQDLHKTEIHLTHRAPCGYNVL